MRTTASPLAPQGQALTTRGSINHVTATPGSLEQNRLQQRSAAHGLTGRHAMGNGAPILIEAHGKLAADSRVAGGQHIRALSHDDRVMEVEDNIAHN